jgi:hypothetical protein
MEMDDLSKIIVLLRFDNIIDANIIKTKLDAYGIPCFLTEENVTSLVTPLLSGGIRLHIFEKDKEAVIQLLTEESMRKADDDDLLRCPSCRSRRIISSSYDRFQNASLITFLLQLTKQHYCLDCETEFDD